MIRAPNIITRSQWRAAAPIKMIRGMRSYTHIVIHHAAGNYASNLTQGKKQVRVIQSYHQGHNDWSDIGYHFLIDARGNIYQGRPYMEPKPLSKTPRLVLGAHVCRQNSGKIGICFLGCYHPSAKKHCNDVLTQTSLNAAVKLTTFLCHSYGIKVHSIRGHRGFCKTSYPGNVLHSKLKYIKQRTRKLLNS